MIASRRGFLLGATGLFLAAPAIVRVASLMAIKPLVPAPLVMTISGLMPPISAQRLRGWLVTNYGETTVFIGSDAMTGIRIRPHTAEMIAAVGNAPVCDPGGKVRITPIAFG